MKHTAASKAKLSRTMKRRWALVKQVEKSNGGSEAQGSTAISETTVAYAVGHVEAWIQAYASSLDLPARSLTARVGDVLSRKAGR